MTGVYHYTARNGEGRFIAGSIQAESGEQALGHLRTRALFVTSLESSGTVRGTAAAVFTLWPVDASSRLAFFRSFAALIGSGVQMRRALEVTIEQCRDRRLAEALRAIANDVETGMPLSAAMARRPREFSQLFVAMVRAGEVAGALDEVLERLAQFLERDRALRKRVGSALAYPAIVTCAALGLVLFLVANTVPAFASMFAEMHVQLPLTTRVLIAIGRALQMPVSWLIIGTVTLLAGIVSRTAARVEWVAERSDAMKLTVPIVGTILRKATVARFARTLGTLLRSGVAVMTALDAARDVVENRMYRRCMERLTESLRQGDPMTSQFESSRLFEPLFSQLVRVGEETGALDTMLLRLAEYYELDVETALSTLGSILEPVLIVVLGAVVGTIVASILIPLYSIIGEIK